jgi:hypothetical protein
VNERQIQEGTISLEGLILNSKIRKPINKTKDESKSIS